MKAALAPGLALLWSLALLVRAQALVAGTPHPVNGDEGSILAMGLRLLDGGGLPYVDAVSHRGPVVYWVGEAIAAFGADGWIPMRVAAALSFVAASVFTFLAARAAQQPLAGAVAAVGMAFGTLLVLEAHDGIAFNSEPLLNVFVMAGFWCLVKGLCRGARAPATGWVAAAGALTMLGALSKQVGALSFLPFGLWVLAVAARVGQREGLRLVAGFGAASALTLALVLLPYALAGELAAFWYWFVTYNTDVYMFPLRDVSRAQVIWEWLGNHVWAAAAVVAGLGWIVSRLVRAVGERGSLAAGYQAVGFATTVAVSSVVTLLGAHIGLRDFGHYFVPAIPWLGLLAGTLAESLLGAASRRFPSSRPIASRQALLLVPLLVACEIAWVPTSAAHRERLAELRPPPVCEVVEQHTRPDQPIFVWGFWAEAHVWCRRKPASRYVFSTMVAGFVPWFYGRTKEEDDALAVPGSRRALIDDLESSRPPIILDAHATMGYRTMSRYEELAAYLDARYRLLKRVERVVVYLRKPD